MVAWAAKHHGIVGIGDLRAAGIANSSVGEWLRAGRLFRIHRGVYSTVHPSLLSDEGRWYAAVKACRGNAALSRDPAAMLLRFIDKKSGRTHVSVTDRRDLTIPGVLVHRPRRLDPVDLTVRRGIAVTTPTRTVWDLAAVWPESRVRRAFEKVDGRQNMDRTRMRDLLDHAPSRRGASIVRELLDHPPLPLHLVRSWLEELLLHICSEHRLPLPEPNADLLGYEVDFLWADAMFIVEADGGDHLDPSQRDRDNKQDLDTQLAGYLTRRYSYRAMGREPEVEAEVRSILRQRLQSPSR